jgi:signal transduction histidine kinase
VQIALEFTSGQLRLSIRDDGVGFSPQREHTGMGLASMRERAEGLRGELHINSGQGQGTEILVSVPID